MPEHKLKQWEKDFVTVYKDQSPNRVLVVMPVSMGKTEQAKLREKAALIELEKK